MSKIIVLLILLLNINTKEVIREFTYVSDEIKIFSEVVIKKEEVKEEKEKKEKVEAVLKTYHGPITAYGPDCKGCSGITASGYNVKNTIYYHDKDYGKVRIVAADKSLPFGTIIRIKDLDTFDNIIAIVLDRGSAIGFKRKVYFDLLYKNEKSTSSFGKRYATFEVLRRGY